MRPLSLPLSGIAGSQEGMEETDDGCNTAGEDRIGGGWIVGDGDGRPGVDVCRLEWVALAVVTAAVGHRWLSGRNKGGNRLWLQ